MQMPMSRSTGGGIFTGRPGGDSGEKTSAGVRSREVQFFVALGRVAGIGDGLAALRAPPAQLQRQCRRRRGAAARPPERVRRTPTRPAGASGGASSRAAGAELVDEPGRALVSRPTRSTRPCWVSARRRWVSTLGAIPVEVGLQVAEARWVRPGGRRSISSVQRSPTSARASASPSWGWGSSAAAMCEQILGRCATPAVAWGGRVSARVGAPGPKS